MTTKSEPTTSLECMPLDVSDRLLSCLPTFATLRAAVLSCKTLNSAYSLRKGSILHAVVENETGPVMLEALVVSRATRDAEKGAQLEDVLKKLLDKKGEYWDTTISAKDAYHLLDIVTTASAFEDEFSFRFKNRNSTTSTLNSDESLKFRRAMYYHWMLSLLCHCKFKLKNAKNSQEGMATLMEKSTSFVSILNDLDDKVLCTLLRFSVFKSEIMQRCIIDDGSSSPTGCDIVSITPPVLLRSFKQQSNWRRLSPSVTAPSFIGMGLDFLYKRRAIPNKCHFEKSGILEKVVDDYIDHCENCARKTGWLYNNTCWSLCFELLHPGVIESLLPGLLGKNPSVISLLSKFTGMPNFLQTVLEDIYSSSDDLAKYWAKDKWVCVSCIALLLAHELSGWFLRALVADGHVFKTNCRYGYKCETQSTNPEHADEFNHFCVPGTDKADED